ncbi:MAG: VTT domain-containing protein [Chloroflexi bacterium]|nr:VTT domain-containing protein [Chloroflexota bacterium]
MNRSPTCGCPWYKCWQTWAGCLSLAVSIAVALLIVFVWGDLKALNTYGYVGAFIVGLLESAVIIIPFPAVVLIFALGGVLNPLAVGIAVGTGEVVGSLSLYVAGRGGMAMYNDGQRLRLYLRLEAVMKKRGGIALFLLSTILSPFFYPAGIAAGALKYPLWRFILIVWGGKVIKGVIVAGAGWLGLQWFVD